MGSTGRNMGGGRDLFGAANPVSRTATMRLGAQALWLARKEMKGAWTSYVQGVLTVLALGLAAAVSLSLGVSGFEDFVLPHHGTEEYYRAFFADYLFLLVCALLGANTLLGYYTRNWRGTRSLPLALLRNLPISARALVGSRALGILFALVVGAVAFFVPVYFLSDLGAELGVRAYLLFCAVWVGYGLLGSGISLYFEFTASGRAFALISYAFALPLIVVVALLESTEYIGLVGRVAQLIQSGHGTLLAGLSILAGGAAFLFLSSATAHRLQRRDLPE